MFKRMVLGLLFISLPSVGWAQTAQENYLPEKSQIYFRWDGMQTHRADFNKTAVGKMAQGDTGKFLDELWKYTQEQLENVARNQQQPKLADLLKDFTKLVGTMHEHGIVLGVAAETINPPQVQAVLVFPKAAGESGTLLPLVTKIAEEIKANVTNNKVGKRFVHQIEIEFVKFAWWAEGADAVLFLGTTDPVAYAKDIDAKKTGVAGNPLFKKVTAFKDFKTAARGYIDVSSLLAVASDVAPPAGKIVDETGLRGLKSITLVSGFDGLAERSVVDLDMPKRDALLSFTSKKKISLKDLPVLPNDISGFAAGSITLDKTYDTILNLVDGVARVVAPNEADNIKETIKAFEGTLGVDISKDLFGSLGDLVVSYSAPSDGILGSGAVVALQIKDGKKLGRSIEKIVKAIPPTPVGEVSINRKAYRSGEIIHLQLGGQTTNTTLATFGIYKNWLIYGQYPQPVKGFILRQEGELPAWKANASLTKALGQFPQEFTAIRVSDPRPTVQTILSALPLAFHLGNSFGTPFIPGFRPFDIDLIPHAQEATRHLFPNVSVTIDDGTRIRTESRGSLPF